MSKFLKFQVPDGRVFVWGGRFPNIIRTPSTQEELDAPMSDSSEVSDSLIRSAVMQSNAFIKVRQEDYGELNC